MGHTILLCDFFTRITYGVAVSAYSLFYLCLWFCTSVNTIMNQNTQNAKWIFLHN
ncbi:hypothetical protein JHK82_018379 [Glycine max]|uniref:Uncharacterized protein n=1 Tax=Glycine soja TaxID=3848 RepID=A0A445JVY0_GLYSO|nr:hypothetical protein JHK87_018265 [Glycine soja]KAG5022468.1 hypothetical protein JHK85_018810 [Glycine max]KAG5037566.1 hypothetical protein JHK86_018406 [Glycine max]KAG5142684.1 hypothetical protein JHK82_018379 [Glycine max]RZC02674.1 hypothetical protein D0Y65_017685 [Glycine soja]